MTISKDVVANLVTIMLMKTSMAVGNVTVKTFEKSGRPKTISTTIPFLPEIISGQILTS